MNNPAVSAVAPRLEPTLLMVDDEPQLRAVLAEYFAFHHYTVITAADAAAARCVLARQVPDLAILDINMPGEDGLSLARWLRQTQPQIGLVMLTTASAWVDRTIGLEQGADDYVPKPFEMRELLARVRAVLRRKSSRAAAPAAALPARATRFGKFTLDPAQRCLTDAQGTPVRTTAAEYELLDFLARHPHRPQSREAIMEHVRSRGDEVFDRSIDLRMMRLRRKIEDHADKPQIIKTVRNLGYVFVPTA